MAFSSDNLTLATGGDDGLVHLWSAENGAAFETLKGHKGAVLAVAFANDGHLASGAADRSGGRGTMSTAAGYVDGDWFTRAIPANVEIGPDSYVGAGSVITEDVPARSLALGRARQVIKPELAHRE